MSDTASGSVCVNVSSFCDEPDTFASVFGGLKVANSTNNELLNKEVIPLTSVTAPVTNTASVIINNSIDSVKNSNTSKNTIRSNCIPNCPNSATDSSSAHSAGSFQRLPLSDIQKPADFALSNRTSNNTTAQFHRKYKHPIHTKADGDSSPKRRETPGNSTCGTNAGNAVSSAAAGKRGNPREREHQPQKYSPWGCIYFSPSGRGLHLWCGVISMAVVYHMWVIIYRYVFAEICRHTIHFWFPLDYFADFLYVLDMIVSVRTGFLEDGVMQYNSKRMRIHYINSTQFYVDCLSLLPLDFLYLSVGFNSMLRIFRLCKLYKFWQFLDRAERHSTYPNVMRSAKLLFYYLTILHWNACVFKLVNDFCDGLWDPTISGRHTHENRSRILESTELWMMNSLNTSDAMTETVVSDHVYVHSLYWGLLSLISIGSLHKPNGLISYVFLISQGVLGVLLFATVLGHVSNIVAHVSAGQKEFQGRLDRVKNYLSMRRVPYPLTEKVIDWFDYLWYTNKITDEENVLTNLPDKLKAEIAIQMHLDTLKRVEIFQNTEEGFLSELVLRLRMVLFAPGDYVCRKGEIGKQMFIVNRGTLHVLGDDGRSVLATLRAGSYFGELSILNLGRYGNRRTASVRSLGYSDLFRLSKSDLWDVLKEYPAARRKLESHAYKKISGYKLSAPGEIRESSFKPNTVVDDDGALYSMVSECIEPPVNINDLSSGINFTRQRRSYTRGALHSSGDGSDGYASDPSRLSTSVFSPQQSPTPPIGQIPDSACSLQENKNLQKNLTNHPDRVPFDNCPYPPRPFSGSHSSCPSWISHTSAFTTNCNLAIQTGNSQLRERGLCVHGVDCHCSVPPGRAGFGEDFALPQTRNSSVPSNLTERATVMPLLGYSASSFTNQQGLYQPGMDDEFCSPVCLPCEQNTAVLEGIQPQHSSTVRFILDDFDDLRTMKDISDYDNMRVADERTRGFDWRRTAVGNIPSILLEGASNSSSSRSPSLEPKSSVHSTSPIPHCSFQPNEIPPEVGWDYAHLLSVPRLRTSTSASVRPPWPRVCQPFNMASMCPNKHQNSTAYQPSTSRNCDMVKEFSRLRKKIHMLECENALLQKHSRRTSLDSNVRPGLHGPINLTGPAKAPDPGVTVKRSTSLQVPTHEKRARSRGSNKPLEEQSGDSDLVNNSG